MPATGSYQPLRPGQVHVWYASLNRTPEEIRTFEGLISREELTQARRFKKTIDQQRYIVSQGILRESLAEYLRLKPPQVEINLGSNGKPFPADKINPENLQFSLSHSDAYAAYAFRLVHHIGVDIEKIRDLPDLPEIVEEHFTHREKQVFLSCPEEKRFVLFYRFWTRKEAVLKALGEGLLRPLNAVDVSAGGDDLQPFRVRVSGEGAGEEFWVRDIRAPEGFIGAVATDGTLDEISIFSK